MHLLEGPDLLSYGEVRKERKGKKKKKAQHPRSLEFLAPKVWAQPLPNGEMEAWK